MMKVSYRKYRKSDLEECKALDLRSYDRKELQALRKSMTLPEIIEESIMTGKAETGEVFVALVDGKIIGLFGNVGFIRNPDFGVIWAFGTNEAYDHMDELNGIANMMIRKWERMYPKGIGNVMSLENNPAVKWIQGFGFRFIGRTMDINGVLFRMFKKGGNHV